MLCEWCDEEATVDVAVKGKSGNVGRGETMGFILHACEAHEQIARQMAGNWHPASEGSLADEMEAA
jgi:hypothetical protein